jgi:phosphinothricin acetyltransferase
MAVRTAKVQDAPAICDIWNDVIRDTLVTFTTEEKQPEAIADRIANAPDPFFVATDTSGAVVGFATYGPFRSGPGYAFCKEHSVMLRPGARGQGIGCDLMATLEKAACAHRVHSLIAGISAQNPGAVAFHRSLGFADAGCIRQAGFKHGQWIDLILMQKIIG